MSDTIKVSKIEIQIGKKVISLSPNELKELKRVLDETFPEDKIKWIPNNPIYIPFPIEPQLPLQPTWEPAYTITCGNQSISYNEAAETMRLIF